MNFFARYGRMSLLMAATVTVVAGAAGGQTVITDKFLDANFRAEVYKAIGKTAPAAILDSDVKKITGLSVYSKGISSLLGIEYFTALVWLDISFNQLTVLDVSKNTALRSLDCIYNSLTTLDVSKNTALMSLFCYHNQLTALDVTKNTALTALYCFNNQLTALDVSKNTALTDLQCGGNQLTALDVSKNTALNGLQCESNQLTALDVSKNTVLTALRCDNNQLTALDVSKNPALRMLVCSDNLLTALDISKNTAIEWLSCYSNQLTVLDMSKNTVLADLSCNNNKLTSLDVSKNTALTMLYCYSNQLTTLDVSKNTVLMALYCYNNQLTTLDVSKNTALTVLDCWGNQLTMLDVSKNTALTFLRVSSNYLPSETSIIGLNKSTLTEFSINPQYTLITFNTQGGSTVNSQTPYGTIGTIKATKPTDPTRSGHLFGGWYREVTCTGSAWNFNDPVIPNMTLYAKWIPLTETPNRPLYVVADFNQRAERGGANKQVAIKWRYFNPLGTIGKFYVYRRETQPSSGAWALLNSLGIDAEKSDSVLSMSFADNGMAINKTYEYRIVFVEGATVPNATTPPTSNSESISVNTYLPSGTPGTNAYVPYNKTSDTYIVENVTYKDIYGTNPRDLSGNDHEVFRHLLSGYQLSADGNTHLSRWVDMGKLVAPLDADVAGVLAGARTIFNNRKAARPAATAAMTAGRLGSDASVAVAATSMLGEFNEHGGYAIGNYAPVGAVPKALSDLSGVKTPAFWVLDRHLVHGNDVNDDRNAGVADYAYYGVGLIFHDLKLSYLETGSPFFSAVSNLPGVFDEKFNATIAGFRYKFGTIKDAKVSGVKNLSGVTAAMAQKWTNYAEVMVGNEASALNGYEMSEMRGVGSSTSQSNTVGASVEVEVGTKFSLGGGNLGIGVDFEEKVTVGESYSYTRENAWSSSHEFTTSNMFQHTDSRSSSKTVSNTMEYSVDVPVPPHTQVMLRQGPASIEMSIDYDYPVVISYKVTVVALGSRRNSGATSSFMRPIATYGIEKASGNRASALEIDAAENFRVLWGYRDDRTNRNLHSADTVSLSRVWTQMKQATGAVSNFGLLGFENSLSSATDAALETNFVRPIAVSMTDVKPMTVVRSTVKYKSESMNSEIYEFQPIYPLYRIEPVGLDSISLINNGRYYVDKIALTGRNDKGVDYYGFHGDKGGWALTDAAGNPHDGSIAKLTAEAGTGRPIIAADGNNTGVVYMRYLINNNVYSHEGLNGYMTANDLGTRTAIIPIYVRAAGALGIAAHPQGGTVTVASSAVYPLTVDVVATGNVRYQWYVNTVPSSTGGLPISGATGPTYNAPLGTIGVFYYYVAVSIDNPSVEPVVSMPAMVQVEDKAEGGKIAVMFSAGANGAIRATVDGIPIAYGAFVQQGKSVVFTAVPAEGYNVSGWTVNGATLTGNIGATYTLSNVSEAAMVVASFEKSISVASHDRVIPAVRPGEESAAIAPVAGPAAGLTVGPNPASRSSGAVNFFRNGSRVAYATLSIYDASGSLVKKIRVIDDAVGSQLRRKVSSWNLRDAKGRPVPEGAYLVRGVVKASGGQRERVSVVVGVR